MNKQEIMEVRELIDAVIKKNSVGEYSFNYANESFDEALQYFSSIKLRYNDNIEFLTESVRADDFRIISARMILNNSINDQEDMHNLINDLACEYYREEFLDEIDRCCDYAFDEDKLDAGLEAHIDSDNGETRWVGIGRSL